MADGVLLFVTYKPKEEALAELQELFKSAHHQAAGSRWRRENAPEASWAELRAPVAWDAEL